MLQFITDVPEVTVISLCEKDLKANCFFFKNRHLVLHRKISPSSPDNVRMRPLLVKLNVN